ncbi:MAG: hypothetical protein HC880_21680 [Bacteroidia bacterium]|nr:hypothetical protein [Bacteroidia bacterium]
MPTGSNLNLKATNHILDRFSLKKLPVETFEKDINELLLFRNKIAHGEKNLPVTQQEVDQFTLLVENLMAEILLRISDGYDQRSYLKQNS